MRRNSHRYQDVAQTRFQIRKKATTAHHPNTMQIRYTRVNHKYSHTGNLRSRALAERESALAQIHLPIRLIPIMAVH